MGIEWVKYSPSLVFASGPVAESFRIDAGSREGLPQRLLEPYEVAREAKRLLQRPPWKRTFLVGPLTSRINSSSGRMGDEDIDLIEGIHRFYEELEIGCYSSFRREDYGGIGIRDEDATLLDKLAIRTSHVLTVLPGSSESNGTWEEICYGGSCGRSFLFLFQRGQERRFRRTLRSMIANLSVHPQLVFISFTDSTDLFEQMAKVWSYVSREPTEAEVWEENIKLLLREPGFTRLQQIG